MKIRRTLATAVVAAVTTPAVLLSVTPALAAAQPAAASQAQLRAAQDKPSIEELEKAAEAAQKAYDDAVAAEKVARATLDAALSDDAPLTVAAEVAEQEAAAAAVAKENADKAVADAKAALAALPETATAEEKAAAEKAVTDAETAAEAAEAAKAAADEKAATARQVAEDARVEAAKAYSVVKQALKDALEAKEAADKALADAKEEAEEGEEDCVFESKLTTVVSGLPSKIVAGSTTDFSLRVTNGTDKTLDEVFPFVYFHATDKSGYNVIDDAFHLQWSTAASPAWKNVEEDGGYAGSVSPLKAGAHADVKLRLKVDAKAPAGDGLAFVAGDYINDDESCGGNDFTEYAFELLAAGSDAGKVDDAKPGKTTPQTPDNKPQGVTSTTPVNSGSLANTGSSSALPQLAAAAGAAVALGAGAVFVVRRRKAGSAA
ncbi:LAETG motif-containing sortase-dependent surface protein [Streptomyces sp. NPDC059909]|uniref:LAETG motif-containing sortase-dependent surface protein n=1 Tax=Streptomyces sp. NPDC059909 TaxID=3346998 RepID=UPI00365302F9